MIPLVDIHCHLLAGLDDGPRTDADALEMCRIAWQEGTRLAAATAHQNERYPQVTPQRIREATQQLSRALHEAQIPITVFPVAEVMACPDLETRWKRGEFISIADRGQYLLLEMPHNVFVDLRNIVRRLVEKGVRTVLAHPERCPELLHESGPIEELISAGALVQVSTHSITHPKNRETERALQSWFRRDIVHVLGSDGHSPTKRPPRIAAAYRQVVKWAGDATADRVSSTNGMAILQGLPLRIPTPRPMTRRWFF